MQPGEQRARMARPAGQAEPADHHIKFAVAEIGRHVAERDEGAVLRFVHELEHELGPWSVNPWRLVEHLALTAIQAPAEETPHGR